jgi:hypothetical protein
MKLFYYSLLKRKLYFYIILGIVLSLVVGINRYMESLRDVKEKQLITFQKLAIKRDVIIRDLENLRENLRQTKRLVSYGFKEPELAIFERLDYIRGLNSKLTIKLGQFQKTERIVSMPVTIELRTDSFKDITDLFQRLIFKKFPLFRFQDTILKKSEATENISTRNQNIKGDMIICIIKGEVFIPRYGQ